MKFANINTQQITTVLPSVLVLPDVTIQNPTLQQYAAQGWRRVTQEETPAAGVIPLTWTITELNGTDCSLTIATSTTQAQVDADALVASKTAAEQLASVGTTETGIVIRALSALMLQEINTLRQRASLSQYTAEQFKTALIAKIQSIT